jgi:hypothetical protein
MNIYIIVEVIGKWGYHYEVIKTFFNSKKKLRYL